MRLATLRRSATLSYDIDTDPIRRAFNPGFYGYIPDHAKQRAVLFVTMTFLPSVQVLIKGILVVIIVLVSFKFALYYLVGEMLFYLVFKILRGGEELFSAADFPPPAKRSSGSAGCSGILRTNLKSGVLARH